ncbi:MAG: adenosine deaminase [Phycisphaerales bacterium]
MVRRVEKTKRRENGTAAVNRGRFAELHLHLGGAILPNILHSYLRRHEWAGGHSLLRRYPTLESFERYFARPRRHLDEYLQMHRVVEQIQQLTSLSYFIQRLIRGVVLFDNLAYMELRYTPWFRTDAHMDEGQRLRQMDEVVDTISAAAGVALRRYPLRFRQILCMHSTLPKSVNRRIVELAARRRPEVVAVDLAGPDRLYAERGAEWVGLFKLARRSGLRTTAHLYETPAGCVPAILPHVDRIGHGIQIPLRQPGLLRDLARRGQCLEVCPTSYLRTGTLKRYEDLRGVFRRCLDAGVPVAICSDNSGLHQVRLPHEYENLLVADLLDFDEMAACHRASFEHAFDWEGPAREL